MRAAEDGLEGIVGVSCRRSSVGGLFGGGMGSAEGPRNDDEIGIGLLSMSRDNASEFVMRNDGKGGCDGDAVESTEGAEYGEERVAMSELVVRRATHDVGRPLRQLEDPESIDGDSRLMRFLGLLLGIGLGGRECWRGDRRGLEILNQSHDDRNVLHFVQNNRKTSLEATSNVNAMLLNGLLVVKGPVARSGQMTTHARRVDPNREGSGHEREDDGVKNEHGEEASVENASLQD